MDTDSGRQPGARRLLIEVRDGVEDRETGANAALGIVIVGLGIAEEGHHAIAKVFGDMATEAGNRLRGSALIARHRLTPLFGIELSCNRGRADQVAEEYRQTAPLPGWSARARLSLRMKRRGSIEWRSALRAELGLRRIIETAFLTSALQRSCASNAKLRALGVFR
jgi:hypothetical protein